MQAKEAVRTGWLLTALALGAGCVGGDAPDDPFALPGAMHEPAAGAPDAAAEAPATNTVAAASAESHFPLVDGARWVYHHAGPTVGEWDEIATLSATTHEGQPAFELRGEEDAEGVQTTSVLLVQGSGVYRIGKRSSVHGELAFVTDYAPGFLRYDEAWSKLGQSQTLDDAWKQRCLFDSIAKHCAPGAMRVGSTTHIYEVVALSTRVSVPAGEFDAVEIKRTNPGNLADPGDREVKLFWFAAGVGKVREENPASGSTEELAEFLKP